MPGLTFSGATVRQGPVLGGGSSAPYVMTMTLSLYSEALFNRNSFPSWIDPFLEVLGDRKFNKSPGCDSWPLNSSFILNKWVLHPSKGNMERGLFTISEFTPNDQALGWYCASVPNSQGFEKTQWGLRRAVKAGLYLGLSSGGNCCSEHKWVSQSKLIKTKADNVSCFVFLP